MSTTRNRIDDYIAKWQAQGYPDDIPDEVPTELMHHNLAPSYKAICICLLKNDLYLQGLGYSTPKSEWYSVIKRVEIEERNQKKAA